MNPMNVLIGGLAGLLAVAFLAMAIRAHRRRGSAPDPIPAMPAVEPLMDGPAGFKRLGNVLKPKDRQAIDELRNRVTQAGLYNRDAVDLFLTVRLTLMVGGLALTLLLASTIDDPPLVVLVFVLVMGLSVLAPGMWLGARTRARHVQILGSLPATVDLLVTCLEAGLNLEQALDRVSSQQGASEDLLARELSITLAEMKAGLTLDVAFRKLAARIGLDDVNTLTAVITQASALGTNIAGILRDHAKTMRQHRMLMLEESAGKANAKLTLPLTMCLLPAVMTLLLGPAVLMFFRSM